MRPRHVHRFDLTPEAARALQSEWAPRVVARDDLGPVNHLAGADASYDEATQTAFAAVAVLKAETLETVELQTARVACDFPYVPHLLSFRELPALMAAFEKLRTVPDLVVCDGQGRAHARRFGIACHLGVMFDVPAIGCAKTRLTGTGAMPAAARGSFSELISGGEVIGRILRTRDGVQPLYVSIGHRVSLETACDWVLKLTPRFRLPETTRAADKASKQREG